jgi:hypothetical protein
MRSASETNVDKKGDSCSVANMCMSVVQSVYRLGSIKLKLKWCSARCRDIPSEVIVVPPANFQAPPCRYWMEVARSEGKLHCTSES